MKEHIDEFKSLTNLGLNGSYALCTGQEVSTLLSTRSHHPSPGDVRSRDSNLVLQVLQRKSRPTVCVAHKSTLLPDLQNGTANVWISEKFVTRPLLLSLTPLHFLQRFGK